MNVLIDPGRMMRKSIGLKGYSNFEYTYNEYQSKNSKCDIWGLQSVLAAMFFWVIL